MPIPLGQLAYEAYCESRNWSSVKGELLPPWHDQSPDLKAAWNAAALAVELHLSQPISLSPSGTTSFEQLTNPNLSSSGATPQQVSSVEHP